jgi:aryl-alcohol dehydrogenase-like predicted oxidoreductase
MNLALGTVQFGLPYGVTNTSGQTTRDEAGNVLAVAEDAGIRLIDTAAQYGDAETIIGDLLQEGHPFQVITKTVRFSGKTTGRTIANEVMAGVNRSFDRLRLPYLYGILVHDHQDLLGNEGDHLFNALSELRDEKRVLRLGVSVYGPEEALTLTERYPLDIVQIPLNALDQRAVRTGAIEILRNRGVEIHIRSVFLQGALLDPERAVMQGLVRLKEPLRAFAELANRHSLTLLEAALAFVRAQSVDAVVIGVTGAQQLNDIIEAWQRVAPLPKLPWSLLDTPPADAVDPRKWM